MQEKCLIYIEKILKVADFFLNLVNFLLNPPICLRLYTRTHTRSLLLYYTRTWKRSKNCYKT